MDQDPIAVTFVLAGVFRGIYMVQKTKRLTATWDSALLVSAVLGLFPLAGERADAQQWPSYGTLLNGNVLPDTEVAMLSHSDRLFPVNIVLRKGRVRALSAAPEKLGNVNFHSGGKEYDLFYYIASNHVAGLVFLKDGKIAFEV